MQRLWGRKVCDAGFGEFLQRLEWIAKKKNKLVIYIDLDDYTTPQSSTLKALAHKTSKENALCNREMNTKV